MEGGDHLSKQPQVIVLEVFRFQYFINCIFFDFLLDYSYANNTIS
jgi:hypothetical protein